MGRTDHNHRPSVSLPPAGASPAPLEPTAFAARVIAGSKRHLALCVLLTCAIAVMGVALGAPWKWLAALGVIGASQVLYNVLRIRGARRALRSAQAGGDFIGAQKRSHLLRGKVLLVVSPLLLLGVGVGLAREQPSPSVWIVFAVIGAFLGYGWLWWFRALRRVKSWRAAPA
jgi:Flp pilus assembly protein TadB